jgi:NADH-quinone oxidoreductase subunit J
MMNLLAYLAFGFYLCIIAGGAGAAVFSANLVRALLGLIATLFGVAGMYLLLQSPFLAFMQLLIYVGAVCVLVFFALMLTNAHSAGDEAQPAAGGKSIRSLLAALAPLVALLPVLLVHKFSRSRSRPQRPRRHLWRKSGGACWRILLCPSS